MNKRKYKNKKDIEALVFIYLSDLKEEKKKKYSVKECDTRVVYLFDNEEDFKSYFTTNGFADISEKLLEICIIWRTQKGTIIALKELCDYAIRKYNQIHSHVVDSQTREKQQFDVLAVPCDMAFVVSEEKVEEFKNLKPNYELREENKKILERISNIKMKIDEPDKVMVKTIKPNGK